MNSISEKEIFRRLQLVRDTRLAYVKKYGLSDEEIRFRYDLLKRLDEAEYIKVETTNLRCIRYGKYEHTKVVTNFDPVKDALLNRGEVQGYWGDSTTVSGNFETELGYLYVDDTTFYPRRYYKRKDLEEIKAEIELKHNAALKAIIAFNENVNAGRIYHFTNIYICRCILKKKFGIDIPIETMHKLLKDGNEYKGWYIDEEA